MTFNLRGMVAAAGIGATAFYRRGEAPHAGLELALRAIVAACDDAGLDPRDVDGFASYAGDVHDGTLLMQSLGTRELCWSSMAWGGGGGGLAAAIGAAAGAICTGQARRVVIYRALAERDQGRFATSIIRGHLGPHYEPHGIVAPAQICGIKMQRLLHAGVPREAVRSFVLAEYHHAQNNPLAQAYGRPLSVADYDSARMIADPYRLYDCSRESDVAAAVLLTSAEEAKDLRRAPVFLLGVAQGGPGQVWENEVDYCSAGFKGVAKRLWRQSGLTPGDVDVAQVYESFSGAAVAAMIDHGLTTIEESAEFFQLQNLIAPSGRLPTNTAGGNIAEGNAHGMGLALEAVRQLRGDSPNPVPGAKTCLLTGGPTSPLVSSALFGTIESL
jgi:acetyl-CoA acetyltransferase